MGISIGAAMLISAVVGAGASVYSASQTPDISAPQIADTPQIQDKGTGQVAEKLDEAASGDTESKKRKRQSTKSKYKVEKAPSITGVSTDTGGVSGVQI